MNKLTEVAFLLKLGVLFGKLLAASAVFLSGCGKPEAVKPRVDLVPWDILIESEAADIYQPKLPDSLDEPTGAALSEKDIRIPDKIEPVPETEPLPAPADEATDETHQSALIMSRPSLPKVPDGAPLMHVYSLLGCKAGEHAARDLKALGVPVQYFTPAQTPGWVTLCPTMAWKVGDKWFYEREFGQRSCLDAEALLLKYVASLPRAAAFTATPAETIQAVLADGEFRIPVQERVVLGGMTFATSGQLAGSVSGNVVTFEDQPRALVGFGIKARIASIELGDDSLTASLIGPLGIRVTKRIRLEVMEDE